PRPARRAVQSSHAGGCHDHEPNAARATRWRNFITAVSLARRSAPVVLDLLGLLCQRAGAIMANKRRLMPELREKAYRDSNTSRSFRIYPANAFPEVGFTRYQSPPAD